MRDRVTLVWNSAFSHLLSFLFQNWCRPACFSSVPDTVSTRALRSDVATVWGCLSCRQMRPWAGPTQGICSCTCLGSAIARPACAVTQSSSSSWWSCLGGQGSHLRFLPIDFRNCAGVCTGSSSLRATMHSSWALGWVGYSSALDTACQTWREWCWQWLPTGEDQCQKSIQWERGPARYPRRA